ncbi:MAG: ATP-binding cassette domain-containing protein [Planctomycetia bacterium]|nr:ATP-binding cassette domain-containing protein [Planctomycetia bacterium]
MTPPPILDFQHVSHFAGQKALLSDVTWQIRPGEHWVLLGPNGAGKTTLLRIACGYVWPNGGGQVLRDGQDRVDLGALRRNIGWLTSQLATQIPPGEIVRATVLSGRFAQFGLKRLPGLTIDPADEREADTLLAEIGCTQFADRTFGTLSQGEQQKVLIARAYMARRKLLILDEPCAGLDPAARESFLEAIDRLARQPSGPSLIFVTHHVEEIVPSFTQALLLREGKVLRSGETQQIVDAGMLSTLYGRQVGQLNRHGGRFWLSW